jgi:hypothetical protein
MASGLSEHARSYSFFGPALNRSQLLEAPNRRGLNEVAFSFGESPLVTSVTLVVTKVILIFFNFLLGPEMRGKYTRYDLLGKYVF